MRIYIMKISNKIIFQDIMTYNNYNYYNVIISFNKKYENYTDKEIDIYLFQIYNLLMSDGIFYLKLNNNIVEDCISRYNSNEQNTIIIFLNVMLLHIMF